MSEKLWATPRSYGFNRSHRPGLTTLDCQVRGLYLGQERYHGVPIDLSQLTLFAEAFPVNRIRSLADVPDAQTSATCGPSLSDSFASFNRDGSWRKTCQGYSQVTLDGSLEAFSETWPRAGMTRNGTAYRLQPLVPLTDATESGSWPTPCAQEDGKTPEAHLAMKARMKGGPRYTITSLQVAAKMWPTPNVPNGGRSPKGGMSRTGMTPDGKKRQVGLENAVKLWATPTARDFKSPGTAERLAQALAESSRGQPLTEQVGGQLNPTWVEWLMGYPLAWTVCAAWATRSSRRSRNGSRGASSKRSTPDAGL